MEVEARTDRDPSSWILVDIQAEKVPGDNPFEVVESADTQIVVQQTDEKQNFESEKDDDDENDSEDGDDEDDEEGEGSEAGETQFDLRERPTEHAAGQEDISASNRLQNSLESIQQSLLTLQTESKLNASEIEYIRARLDKLLFRQRQQSCELDITCKKCCMEIGRQADIVSREFRGQSGPAVLIRQVYNVRYGQSTERTLMTGIHITAWEFCKGCGTKLGWRYVGATNPDQKYKIGMSCIETASVDQ